MKRFGICLIFLPLGFCFAALAWLNSRAGTEWAYSLFELRDHPLNFGGNPSEILSHLLNWIAMQGSLAVLCIGAIVRLHTTESATSSKWNRIIRLVTIATLLVVLGWAAMLDSRAGEGVTPLTIGIFFAPALVACHFALLSLTTSPTHAGLKTCIIVTLLLLSAGLQRIYEPSNTGGPDLIAVPLLWLLSGLFYIATYAFKRLQLRNVVGATMPPS